jgi:hypothetical protein
MEGCKPGARKGTSIGPSIEGHNILIIGRVYICSMVLPLVAVDQKWTGNVYGL